MNGPAPEKPLVFPPIAKRYNIADAEKRYA
jgi:hypothetical protein